MKKKTLQVKFRSGTFATKYVAFKAQSVVSRILRDDFIWKIQQLCPT